MDTINRRTFLKLASAALLESMPTIEAYSKEYGLKMIMIMISKMIAASMIFGMYLSGMGSDLYALMSSGFKQSDKAFDLHIASSQTYFKDGQRMPLAISNSSNRLDQSWQNLPGLPSD